MTLVYLACFVFMCGGMLVISLVAPLRVALCYDIRISQFYSAVMLAMALVDNYVVGSFVVDYQLCVMDCAVLLAYRFWFTMIAINALCSVVLVSSDTKYTCLTM